MKIKMMLLYLVYLLPLLDAFTFAQSEHQQKENFLITELNEFYDGEGIIFGKDEPYFGYGEKIYHRITITLSDVINAEVILDSITNSNFKDNSLKINEIKAKRRKYNRQYWGLQTPSGEKIVVMNIFNFSTPELVEFFKSWDKGCFFSTLDIYNENARIYWINLTKRKIEDGSWSLEL